MDYSTRPSNVRVYQFHHFGIMKIYYNKADVFKAFGPGQSAKIADKCLVH